GLRACNYIVDVAYDGSEGFYLSKVNSYDMFIFDYMMPGMDGIELTKHIRDKNVKNKHKPILLLTAKDDTQSKVDALDGGADDYLTKPFSFDELLARVRALTRRLPNEIATKNNILEYGDIEMDLARRTVKKEGKPLLIGKKEFSL